MAAVLLAHGGARVAVVGLGPARRRVPARARARRPAGGGARAADAPSPPRAGVAGGALPMGDSSRPGAPGGGAGARRGGDAPVAEGSPVMGLRWVSLSAARGRGSAREPGARARAPPPPPARRAASPGAGRRARREALEVDVDVAELERGRRRHARERRVEAAAGRARLGRVDLLARAGRRAELLDLRVDVVEPPARRSELRPDVDGSARDRSDARWSVARRARSSAVDASPKQPHRRRPRGVKCGRDPPNRRRRAARSATARACGRRPSTRSRARRR